MKIKAFRRVELTRRDLLLLRLLYENVVLSFPQAWRRGFPGVAKSTALNRLAQLESAGVLRRWRVPKFPAGKEEAEILVVFQITRNGLRELGRRAGLAIDRDEPPRLHGYTLHHDVLLVDVMEALGKRIPGSSVTHGRLIARDEVEQDGIEPDALWRPPAGGPAWAIELELTAKSDKRYRDIVLRYQLSRRWSRVLYVAKEERIKLKLERVLGHAIPRLGLETARDRFAYLALEELFPKTKGPQMMIESTRTVKSEVTNV